jgi:hypothetical protein
VEQSTIVTAPGIDELGAGATNKAVAQLVSVPKYQKFRLMMTLSPTTQPP